MSSSPGGAADPRTTFSLGVCTGRSLLCISIKQICTHKPSKLSGPWELDVCLYESSDCTPVPRSLNIRPEESAFSKSVGIKQVELRWGEAHKTHQQLHLHPGAEMKTALGCQCSTDFREKKIQSGGIHISQ